MKLKIFVLILIASLSSNIMIAQLSAVGFKSEEFQKFKASKTYFVKSGNSTFDNSVMEAMKNNWKVTPFEEISQEDFKTKVKDPSISFLSLILIGEPNHGYHYFGLFNGGKKKISNYDYGDLLAYAPVNRWVDEPELTDCGWRAKNMLEGMVQAMDIVQKQDIKGNTLSIVNQLRDYYNAKAPQIKNRTLLIAEPSMGRKFKKSDITGSYPYKVEICDRAKIEKAITEKSTEYYYLQPTITLNKSWFVIDPSNGEVLYFNYATMGLNITLKNVEELVTYIKK